MNKEEEEEEKGNDLTRDLVAQRSALQVQWARHVVQMAMARAGKVVKVVKAVRVEIVMVVKVEVGTVVKAEAVMVVKAMDVSDDLPRDYAEVACQQEVVHEQENQAYEQAWQVVMA